MLKKFLKNLILNLFLKVQHQIIKKAVFNESLTEYQKNMMR